MSHQGHADEATGEMGEPAVLSERDGAEDGPRVALGHELGVGLALEDGPHRGVAVPVLVPPDVGCAWLVVPDVPVPVVTGGPDRVV